MTRTLLVLAVCCSLAGEAAAQAPAAARGKVSTADSAFMTDMIGHHAQAIVMANLAPGRVANDQVKTLADRIIVSQRDEIAAMETWLLDHGLPVPDSTHRYHGPGAHMPGMLSPAQMKELEAATGPDFDRLFVTLMLQHHQGALTMVDQLLKAPGSHDTFVYKFAADVDADQRAEIERMARLLITLPVAGRTP
jgi:uncharacterized protein (DUF305 family)